MKRKFLFSFYETPQGKLLQLLEQDYLKRSINVSCRQTILQIGHLNWESEFIDSTLYHKFFILDIKSQGDPNAVKICGVSYQLPIKTESVDLVLVPHLLEFDLHRFQTMREIERILKPEGEVVILNFNTINPWIRLHFLWNIKMSATWHGYFILRSRISDWLKILSFEIKTTSEFTLDNILTTREKFKFGRRTFFSMSYAVRAVKRRYTLIPLTPVKAIVPRLVQTSSGLKKIIHWNKNDKK